MKKQLILLILLVLPFAWVDAQQLDILYDMQDRVVVHQDSAISRLLYDKSHPDELKEVQIQGWRVQIYSSNNQQIAKGEAFKMEEKVLSSQLECPVYVQYQPPFWKVRLGDCRTQEAAKELKEIVLQAFPELEGSTYVVRDKINVKSR